MKYQPDLVGIRDGNGQIRALKYHAIKSFISICRYLALVDRHDQGLPWYGIRIYQRGL